MATWWTLTIEGKPSEEDLEHVAGLVSAGFTCGQLIEEPETAETLRFNQHSNNLGDYCPYSGQPVPADYEDEDERCPQACTASSIVDASDPKS